MANALRSRSEEAVIALASRGQVRLGRFSTGRELPERAPDPVMAGFRLIKALAAGAYHRPSDEHLNAYWAELRWRATHADDEQVFRKTVVALLQASPLPYDELVGRRAFASTG
jgi:hypothetical protein